MDGRFTHSTRRARAEASKANKLSEFVRVCVRLYYVWHLALAGCVGLPCLFPAPPALQANRHTDTHKRGCVCLSGLSTSAVSTQRGRLPVSAQAQTSRCPVLLWLNLLKVCVSLHLCEWWTWWTSPLLVCCSDPKCEVPRPSASTCAELVGLDSTFNHWSLGGRLGGSVRRANLEAGA